LRQIRGVGVTTIAGPESAHRAHRAQPAVNVALTSVEELHDLAWTRLTFPMAADRGETIHAGIK